ncbi:MAG: metallophosphoesterase [Clostridia bacterium]|nr:metallophosphoesterase [Clostridia bacterium]
MKTVAIGDIHGCYDELAALIETVKEKEELTKENCRWVFLGDYIDRGDDSRRVIALIRKMQKEENNVVALMGNHEEQFLRWKITNSVIWFINGGEKTLDSYGSRNDEFISDSAWIKNLRAFYQDEHFIFVHAGMVPEVPLEKQSEHDLLWIREPFIKATGGFPKTVIFGHTPTLHLNNTAKPMKTVAGNINIDTGCVFGGTLTALVTEDGKIKKAYCIRQRSLKLTEYGPDEF